MKSQSEINCTRHVQVVEPAPVEKQVLTAVVPYTTPELTRAALRHIGVCSDLDVRVSLLDVQVVPFPCPLDRPPIDKEFSVSRLQGLIAESGLRGRAGVLYTRDWVEGFQRVLGPESLVVLTTKHQWWPTREKRLAQTLSKAGHQVTLLRVR